MAEQETYMLHLQAHKNDIDREMREFKQDMLKKFDDFKGETLNEQRAHHKENRARLQSIDHQARNNGQSAVELKGTVENLNMRLNLLFNEDGKGYVDELKREVRALNNKVMYASGFLAAVYFMVSWLSAHHKL